MRKGRNVGRYEMAEDRFFNESSERDYLYDDMMDAVSELIIGTLGNTYSDMDDWIGSPDPVKQQRQEKISNIKSRINSTFRKFMKQANDIQVAMFISEYILGDDIKWFEEASDIDMVMSSQLAKLFIKKLPKENIIIDSIYDLKNICDFNDFMRLELIYDNLNEIYEFEKFKYNIYHIVNKTMRYDKSYSFVFDKIYKKISDSIKNISMPIYRQYKDFFDIDVDICKLCLFIYNTKKYKWVDLNNNELNFIKGFIYGDMRFFNKISRKKIIINDIDIAIVLNKNWAVKYFNNEILDTKYTPLEIAEQMYYIYDCIHDALDNDYVKPIWVNNIIDLYNIGDMITCDDIIIKAMVKPLYVLKIMARYLKSLNPARYSNLNGTINIHNFLYEKLELNNYKDFCELYELLLNMNPKYLLKLYGSDDLSTLSVIFMHLVRFIHRSKEPLNLIYSEQEFIAESALEYTTDILKRCNIDYSDYLRNIFKTIVGCPDDDFKRIVIRLINSADTRDPEFIRQDIELITEHYRYLKKNIILTNK